MEKSTVFKQEKEIFRDRRTGREVWRVSGGAGEGCSGPYMYACAFSEGDRFLVYTCGAADARSLLRLELDSGETLALTGRCDCTPHGFNVHPGGRELFYLAGNRLVAVDLYTLAERAVLDRSGGPGRLAGTPTFSGDGRLVSVFFVEGEESGIVLAESGGGGEREVYRRPGKVGHVQFRPAPGVTQLTFVVSPDRQNEDGLPDELRARAWLLDCETGAARPFLVMAPGFRATHETWDRRGERLYYHKKTVPAWTPTWICSVDASGADPRDHFFSADRKLGHSAVNIERSVLVSDVQDPEGNELYLAGLDGKCAEILCWPDSSVVGHGQNGHVHPSFSRLGDKVVYTSDAGGRGEVYVVPLGR